MDKLKEENKELRDKLAMVDVRLEEIGQGLYLQFKELLQLQKELKEVDDF